MGDLMDVSLIFRGFILGFAIAAPVGPIGLLCIQRTLNQGQLVGLVSGLGAATADAFYGAVAAFGLDARQRLPGRAAVLAGAGGRAVSLLSGRAYAVGYPAQPSSSTQRGKGDRWRIRSTFLLDDHQPNDDPGLCRHFCRGRSGQPRAAMHWRQC